MHLRPISRAARWTIFTAVVGVAMMTSIIAFIHRWSQIVTTPPDEPIGFILTATNIIWSSPLLCCLTGFLGLIMATWLFSLIIGPQGLQTPE